MKKFFISLFSITMILVLTSCLTPRQPHRNKEAMGLGEYIKTIMDEATIPGLAISVIKNNKVVLLKGFGMADIDKNIPVTIQTPFNIASISKPILGISLLRLQDKGLLNIDNDINNYLPFVLDNPKIEGEVITLRHIASHSSGLDDSYDFSAFGHNRDSNIELESYVRQRLDTKGKLYRNGIYFRDDKPDTTYRYNNLATALAGLALETTTKMDLNTFSQQEIFTPLGMHNTSWKLNTIDTRKLAVPYEIELCIPYTGLCADESNRVLVFAVGKLYDPPASNKFLRPYPHYGFPDYPAGGLRSSIEDLTLLIQAIMNNGKENFQLLSSRSYQDMFHIQLEENIAKGQRFFWQSINGKIGHGGSNPGVLVQTTFDLEKGDAITLLMNRSPDALTGWAMEEIINRVANAPIIQ